MKRLCIYLTYDSQKIIDSYISYMLRELKTCVDYLVVVCNEKEVIRGVDILNEYADEVFYRGNIGFDAGGFKDALCKFLGWNKVLKYNELVLVNDSMFGPFKPMKTIFTEMNGKFVDFWGLAKHGECKNKTMGYIPEHIQLYFLVVCFEMLHCTKFKDYWDELPYYSTFHETVVQHEIRFTKYFSDLGYTYSSLADTEINDSRNIVNNYMQYGMISYELIRKRNFPFLKKQQIAYDTLNEQTQENLRQSFDYIDKETDYDINLIWDNIIRTLNIADLQRSLHLQYIISSEQKRFIFTHTEILVFVKYKESVEYVLEYIRGLYAIYPIKIFAENNECLLAYQEQGFECKKLRFNEIIDFLASFSNFEFVCVLHDTDMTSDIKPSCVCKSYYYNIWNNLIKDNNHVMGILEKFMKEPKLGFLASPQPNFAEYFGADGKGWSQKVKEVIRIKQEINLNCQISALRAPFRITDSFWIRGCVLEKLKDIASKDYLYLPYMWSYLAQDAGYYSGIVESTEYASMNEVNLQYYLQQITSQVRRQYGDFDKFFEMKEKMLIGALQEFVGKYSRIIVYGIGEMMQYYKNLFSNIEMYVVSDGQVKPDELDGIPVKYLSELVISADCGIVLCLNEKNQMQVIPLLEERGIKHYFCL